MKTNATGKASIEIRKLALDLGLFDKPLYTLPEQKVFEIPLKQLIKNGQIRQGNTGF